MADGGVKMAGRGGFRAWGAEAGWGSSDGDDRQLITSVRNRGRAEGTQREKPAVRNDKPLC